MGYKVDSNGDITIVQGDGGFDYVLEDLPTDKNYQLYFSVYNSNRVILGSEVKTYTNKASSVAITIPSSLTDLLTVKLGEDTAEYYFGIKLCYEKSVVDAYIVSGATAYSSGWLSLTDGGSALTPSVDSLYIVKSSGTYLNKVYAYNGTNYVETTSVSSKYENTLCIGNKNIGDLNIITVYPKEVEGI